MLSWAWGTAHEDTCFRIALKFMTKTMFGNPVPEGIAEIENEAVLVFPNPVEDYIHLQIGENISDFVMELYDMQGRRLIRSENKTAVNVSALPSGTYILQFNTANGTQFQKVVKK